ncbi:MAG: hypothetical protein HUU25_13265 [Candidatus Sumerlaeia bacterium]|nr:hypothetical protein [Candidatus Sumerlaeia bacterium]
MTHSVRKALTAALLGLTLAAPASADGYSVDPRYYYGGSVNPGTTTALLNAQMLGQCADLAQAIFANAPNMDLAPQWMMGTGYTTPLSAYAPAPSPYPYSMPYGCPSMGHPSASSYGPHLGLGDTSWIGLTISF